MKFHLADLENEEKVDDGAKQAVEQAQLLFVDGGDKALEAKIYARFLALGAGILVHDVNYEAGSGGSWIWSFVLVC